MSSNKTVFTKNKQCGIYSMQTLALDYQFMAYLNLKHLSIKVLIYLHIEELSEK